MRFDVMGRGDVVGRNAERGCARAVKIAHLASVASTIEHGAGIRAKCYGKQTFPQEMRFRISANRDVLDVGSSNAADLEHGLDGERRKASPVLDPPKALFL